MDPPAPAALNGTLAAAAQLLHRYDPPVTELAAELEADGLEKTAAADGAAQLDELARSVGDDVGDDDGRSWQQPLNAAEHLGRTLTSDRQCSPAASASQRRSR